MFEVFLPTKELCPRESLIQLAHFGGWLSKDFTILLLIPPVRLDSRWSFSNKATAWGKHLPICRQATIGKPSKKAEECQVAF